MEEQKSERRNYEAIVREKRKAKQKESREEGRRIERRRKAKLEDVEGRKAVETGRIETEERPRKTSRNWGLMVNDGTLESSSRLEQG